MEQTNIVNIENDLPQAIIDAVGKETYNNFLTGLAALLVLDDEPFEIMSQQFYTTLARTLATPSTKLSLRSLIQSANLTYEDVKELLDKCRESIIVLTYGERQKDWLDSVIVLLINAISEATEGQFPITIETEVIDDGKLPQYAYITDAGADLYAAKEVVIKPGETVVVPTGIKCIIPHGFDIEIRPKSGITSKTKLRVANAPGTIDSNFRGEIGVIIDNIEPPIKDIVFGKDGTPQIEYGKSYTIEKGQKIAQAVLTKIYAANYLQVEKISTDTDRGEGGYGSTGLK